MEKDTRPLFQITEAAHACGLSRSTLLRMEEKGLLAPAYIAPDSGRRYYDNHNVARVLQIEKLKAMGLGTEEIAGYFASGGEVTELLSMLEERLRELSRGVEELRLRAGGTIIRQRSPQLSPPRAKWGTTAYSAYSSLIHTRERRSFSMLSARLSPRAAVRRSCLPTSIRQERPIRSA